MADGGARAIGASVLALTLPACNPLAPFARTETEILQAGLVGPDRFAPPESVFCYRTLAETDCFRRPRPEEAHRFVGAYRPVYVIE